MSKSREFRISPFSTTPGIAGEAYINNYYADEIIANFESSYSTQYVYKLIGLRGSGKSVEYKKVMDHFSLMPEKWKVYALAAGGDPIQAFISSMALEKEIYNYVKTKEISMSGEVEGNALLINGNVAATSKTILSANPNYYSAETEMRTMCEKICASGYTILIGIDDISKTDSMAQFLSIVGSLLLNPKVKIRMVVTGLQKNIEDFYSLDIEHLSFFVRPKPIEVGTLSTDEIELKYRDLLMVDTQTAKALAPIPNGYAWAYSLLGDEYFLKGEDESLEEILYRFDLKMAHTYDLISASLTAKEKEFIKELLNNDGSLALNKQIKGYSQHRADLIKKHLIETDINGNLKIRVPRFNEYIRTHWK